MLKVTVDFDTDTHPHPDRSQSYGTKDLDSYQNLTDPEPYCGSGSRILRSKRNRTRDAITENCKFWKQKTMQFLDQKLHILALGLHEGRPSYERSTEHPALHNIKYHIWIRSQNTVKRDWFDLILPFPAFPFSRMLRKPSCTNYSLACCPVAMLLPTARMPRKTLFSTLQSFQTFSTQPSTTRKYSCNWRREQNSNF